MITAGIDCGAKNTKALIMKDGKILGKAMVLTGFDPPKAILESFESACRSAEVAAEEVERICGAGAGKDWVKKAIPRVHALVDDIEAMAKGARSFFPSSRTVVDVGAEEGRAAEVDEGGNVVDFVVNEKCAAGAGAFVEAMSRALETEPAELGSMALESDKEIPINAQCVIFAESEVVGLIHANTEKKDISRAVHDAMAGRIVSMMRRIGVHRDLVLMGGVGRNPGFVSALKKQLAIENLLVPEEPEYGMAAGAAVAAGM